MFILTKSEEQNKKDKSPDKIWYLETSALMSDERVSENNKKKKDAELCFKFQSAYG